MNRWGYQRKHKTLVRLIKVEEAKEKDCCKPKLFRLMKAKKSIANILKDKTRWPKLEEFKNVK